MRCMKIFFNKYVHWNKYNVVDDSDDDDDDDDDGDVFNYQTPSEYHNFFLYFLHAVIQIE